jgi:hypothetical protein
LDSPLQRVVPRSFLVFYIIVFMSFLFSYLCIFHLSTFHPWNTQYPVVSFDCLSIVSNFSNFFCCLISQLFVMIVLTIRKHSIYFFRIPFSNLISPSYILQKKFLIVFLCVFHYLLDQDTILDIPIVPFYTKRES